MDLSKQDFSLLFDPSVYNNSPSLDHFIKENALPTTQQEVRNYFHSVILSTLHRIGAIQLKYMFQSSNFAHSTKEQTLDYFFEQDYFKTSSPITLTHLNEENAQALFHFHDISGWTEQHCFQEMKTFSFKFGSYSLAYKDIDRINNVLSFIGSPLMVSSSVAEKWQRLFVAETNPLKGYKKAVWVTKELCRMPCINPTLAAFTYSRKIFLRETCFSFMMDMKWLPLYQSENTDMFSTFFPEYLISDIFRTEAVARYQEKSKKEFGAAIKSAIAENVFFHECGHVVMKDFISPETMAIMKKCVLLKISLFESCDEVLADCAPEHDGMKGFFTFLIKLSKKDPEKARDYFYAYASDTWFFDTDDESMYEYSEMIHLIKLRYQSAKSPSINFEQMEKDFDFDNPRSFLTQFVASINTCIEKFKEIVKNEKYIINDNDYSFKFISDLAHKDVIEKKPTIDQESYDYYCYYWANMMVLIETYIKNKKKLPQFHKQAKKIIYKRLFKLTNKEPMNENKAKDYIMKRYQHCLQQYQPHSQEQNKDDFFSLT